MFVHGRFAFDVWQHHDVTVQQVHVNVSSSQCQSNKRMMMTMVYLLIFWSNGLY
jgi:hypothetical protein